MKGISVILCCYNSAQRMGETLTHLANQELDYPIVWENILDDNNSKDNTLSVAKEIWHSLHVGIPFKIISENKQGLAHARRRGIDESKYGYLLFCDDDNWLEKSYLQIAFELLE